VQNKTFDFIDARVNGNHFRDDIEGYTKTAIDRSVALSDTQLSNVRPFVKSYWLGKQDKKVGLNMQVTYYWSEEVKIGESQRGINGETGPTRFESEMQSALRTEWNDPSLVFSVDKSSIRVDAANAFSITITLATICIAVFAII